MKKFKIFVLFLVVLSSLSLHSFSSKKQIHIAVVVSTKKDAKEDPVYRGAQLYVDIINELGGIDNKKIIIDLYNDERNPGNNNSSVTPNAISVAEEIYKSEAVGVIGHGYSDCSIAAADAVYESNGIPVISASATNPDVTKDKEYYFRVIFNDMMQGTFLVNM